MSMFTIYGTVAACIVILSVLAVSLCRAAATRDVVEDTGDYE